jgi:hypothetical protein
MLEAGKDQNAMQHTEYHTNSRSILSLVVLLDLLSFFDILFSSLLFSSFLFFSVLFSVLYSVLFSVLWTLFFWSLFNTSNVSPSCPFSMETKNQLQQMRQVTVRDNDNKERPVVASGLQLTKEQVLRQQT